MVTHGACMGALLNSLYRFKNIEYSSQLILFSLLAVLMCEIMTDLL